MSLETATYIDGLVPTNPTGADPLAQADDHLRLIKATLKATFPNINGAMTATEEQLNDVVTRGVPSGFIGMWSGLVSAVPAGWALCDGSLGTPDLRDRFVIGAGGAYAKGVTGGSKDATIASHTHTFSGTSTSDGSHSHAISDPGHTHTGVPIHALDEDRGTLGSYFSIDADGGTTGLSYTGITINAGGAHTHTVSGTTASTGSSGTNANLPPYMALAYIMKL